MAESVEKPQESAPVKEKSQIAKEFEALKSQPAQPTTIDGVNDSVLDDGGIDVPMSDFWSNKPKAGEEKVEAKVKADVSPSETIRFKANGEDVEISLEDARKKLALAEGGAQAFTKLASANKKLKDLESQLPELTKYKELFDKLESVKHSEDELIRIISGRDPQEWKADFIRKQRILETGSDSEKRQLEREEKLTQLERQLEAQKAKQEELDRREESRKYNSDKDSLKGMLEGEYFKHKFKLDSDLDSNELNEMLWQNGQRTMTKYVNKYKDHPKFQELLPKMVQKSFEDAAGKLNRLTTGSVQAKVDDAIKAKKQKAAEQAAVASTRRISEVNTDDFRGLGIREIADRLVGKKKFTY